MHRIRDHNPRRVLDPFPLLGVQPSNRDHKSATISDPRVPHGPRILFVFEPRSRNVQRLPEPCLRYGSRISCCSALQGLPLLVCRKLDFTPSRIGPIWAEAVLATSLRKKLNMMKTLHSAQLTVAKGTGLVADADALDLASRSALNLCT